MRSPWWFCNGWWSPWCVALDLTHGKVQWICDKHIRANERHLAESDRP